MTKEDTKKALEAYEEWTVRDKITLNGVKEILASRDAWLACWEHLNDKEKRQ